MKVLVIVIGLLFSHIASAGMIDLGAAEEYTVFIKETYEYSTGDVQGHSAIGGEITNTSGQQNYFGQMLDELNIPTPPALLTTAAQYGDAFEHLIDLSTALTENSATGTVNKPWSSKLELTAAAGTGNNDIHYFSFDAADLLNVTEIAISGIFSGQVVLNITGADADISWGGQYINGLHLNYSDSSLDGRSDVDVLYNFVDATYIEMDGTVYASILAPQANVIGTGSVTQWGQLIANSWRTESASQFNYDPLSPADSSITDVAEPSSFILLVLVLMAIFWRFSGFSKTTKIKIEE
ncbi:choice-of-anchor A family protein [Psychrosphaera sp. 1_MG-2023]|nr:choice-of-anchor A family protein [Psychrosphaera sp. 1_MG-2023]MDO6721307.1 choice-of-anchor A family protein [Psychrosphaera sp. 1_MG-2023]